MHLFKALFPISVITLVYNHDLSRPSENDPVNMTPHDRSGKKYPSRLMLKKMSFSKYGILFDWPDS